jgi:alkaline phosphatase D
MTNAVRFYDRAVSRLSRRELLKIMGILGAAALAPPLTGRRLLAKPIFEAYPFSLGVASGDPLPDGIVLWTRLAPKPLDSGGMPRAIVEVGWEIARDAAFRTIVQTGTTLARPELAHSVHVEVAGLEAAREYWYRFHAGGEMSETGRTKTAPPPGAAVDRLRFGVCGCSHYEDGYFTAFRRIAEEDFDFVVHTGDYIYEGRGDGGPLDARKRQHLGGELFTLVDYRNRYAQYKSDRDLMAAHASAPFIVIPDDHEVADDYAGDFDQRGTPPELFVLRRAAAYQAYYEAMPLRASALPSGSHMRIHRRLHFGSLVDLSLLDTRQWRARQVCGGGNRTDCPEALDQGRSILGPEQEKWLFDNLADVHARWTVLGQQVPTFARNVGAGAVGRFWMDKWDGYVAARNRLYTRLLETKAPNPIVLSGDVHQHFAADLKLDFADPRSTCVGVELTNSSITTNGDGSDVSTTWARTRADNPHITYHSARRGYIACTATAAAMRADFKILEKVSEPNQPVRIGGALVVEAGRPGGSTV